MNPTVKKIIGLAATAAVFAVLYYGTWLPLDASMAFIGALRTQVKSVSQFEQVFSPPLDLSASSPIGYEELVRNTGNTVLSIIQQNTSNPQVTEALLAYLESYYKPVVARGKGMSFEQNLYILGAANEIAYLQTKKPEYLNASIQYFNQGLALGPKRPQFLYGMFDALRMKGDVHDARIVGEQILSEWPTDMKTAQALASLPPDASSSAPRTP